MIAEESTSWPGVSAPTYKNGLGFGRKWNMGWMNDTLKYIELDPVYRKHNSNFLTFGLLSTNIVSTSFYLLVMMKWSMVKAVYMQRCLVTLGRSLLTFDFI